MRRRRPACLGPKLRSTKAQLTVAVLTSSSIFSSRTFCLNFDALRGVQAGRRDTFDRARVRLRSSSVSFSDSQLLVHASLKTPYSLRRSWRRHDLSVAGTATLRPSDAPIRQTERRSRTSGLYTRTTRTHQEGRPTGRSSSSSKSASRLVLVGFQSLVVMLESRRIWHSLNCLVR